MGIWHGDRLLGPVTAQQRSVLAALLLDLGQVVSVERLIEAIWGENPPRSARNAVQGCVSKLRRMVAGLPGVELATSVRGYRLAVAGERVDLHRFRALVDRAQSTDHADARLLMVEALRLWRGSALVDVSDSRLFGTAGAALEEERLVAIEKCVELAVSCGRHQEQLAELSTLVAAHPLREKFVCLLMSVLHHSGRQAEALELFRDTRRRLIEELGVEPGSELQDTHRRILNGERVVSSASHGGRTPPRQLPADVAHFTGRERALETLSRWAGGVTLLTIEGTAGVGKTALALRFAHRDAVHFSDGQLYVDLRGFDPERPPLSPAEALGRLVRAMGVEARKIPAEPDELAAMYRSLSVDRRMLILLDDAAAPDQVRPLIPGTPTCLVLVTSRNRLRGLVAHDGARPLTLAPLRQEESLELVGKIIGGSRVAAEPEATAELARLCGGLPLALRIAAANVSAQPGRDIADHVTELTEGRRLDVLVIEGDEQRAVRTAFDLSYSALGPAEAHLFRHLALLPGASFTAGAVAALTGRSVSDCAISLRRLASACLVEEHVGGRFHLHDMVAVYCAERAWSDQSERHRDEARHRLIEWYLVTACAADQLLKLPFPHEPQGEAVCFTGAADALAWLEAERHNLVAAVEQAAAHGPRPAAWHLADALRGFFWLRKHHADWKHVSELGLRAAELEADDLGQAAMAGSLAQLHADLGEHESSIDHYTQALETSRSRGWRQREASTMCNLGNRHAQSGNLDQAITYFTEALTLARATSWRDGEAKILGNLGGLCWDRGRLHDALEYCTQSLLVWQEFGLGYGRVVPLLNLGRVQLELGDVGDAADNFGRALALSGAAGAREGQAKCLLNMARAHCWDGDYDASAGLAERALSAIQDIEATQARAEVLNILAGAKLKLGAAEAAMDHQRHSLGFYRARRYARGEAEALVGLAQAHLHLTWDHDALTHAERALTLASATGHRVVESRALMALSDIHFARGDHPGGVEYAHRALTIHHDTGYRPRWKPAPRP
ncbi:AfsR/SARP family transcriptional regulator [Nonomuraea endophytica]|uniref:AfsR/SARP family transcriptional regulator n=1 Tax=Nonomuraea endophytica TaxID=714136 RepID=UPI0037C572AF